MSVAAYQWPEMFYNHTVTYNTRIWWDMTKKCFKTFCTCISYEFVKFIIHTTVLQCCVLWCHLNGFYQWLSNNTKQSVWFSYINCWCGWFILSYFFCVQIYGYHYVTYFDLVYENSLGQKQVFTPANTEAWLVYESIMERVFLG